MEVRHPKREAPRKMAEKLLILLFSGLKRQAKSQSDLSWTQEKNR
jgi:hypothetical protein